MITDFVRLHQKGQKNLIRFLSLEVELGQTMVKIAKTTETAEHRARLLKNVREAIAAIHRFSGRIDERSVRSELNRKAAKLKECIASTKRRGPSQNHEPTPSQNRGAPREISSR